MIQGIQSALAGLAAASKRADIAANNIANARSTGTLQPYGGFTPQQAVQTVTAAGTPRVVARPLTPGHVAAYEPDSPDADADGLIGAPNVDLAANIVELTLAEHAYKANAATLRTIDEMAKALYDDEV
ncbi:MAG: flagellar basal body rod C-terminal domain-containing protein [Alphaproteobacteria bacterium]|jgi:flagellar basal-body rod protein FlgC